MIVRADSTEIPRAFLPALDTAFAKVIVEARGVYGSAADTMLAGEVLTLTPRESWEEDASQPPGVKDWVFMQARGRLGPGSAMEYGVSPSPWNMEAHFVGWFTGGPGRRLPAALRTWATNSLPLRPRYDEVFLSAYRSLALHDMGIARSCLDGVLLACRAALGIAPGNDTLRAWLTPDEMRDRAQKIIGRRRYITERLWYHERCVVQRIDSICLQLVRQDGWYARAPIGADTRRHFLRFVIARGGPDALSRIVAQKTGDIRTLLEAGAGVPIDTLIAEWRAGVLTARRSSPTPSGIELAGGLALVAFFIGFSGRSKP
jgi:hypothetical protein